MSILRQLSLAALLANGLGLAATSAAEAAPVYVRTTTASVFLPATPGTAGRTRVLAVSVPAGFWTITAKASLVARFDNNTFDVMRCVIRAGSRQLDSAATNVGSADSRPSVATVALAGAVRTTAASTTIELACLHDLPIANEYVDPDAKLIVSQFTGPIR